MSAAALPSLSDVRSRHDEFIARVLAERRASPEGPVAISDALAAEISQSVTQLYEMGAQLYDDTERSAALSVMSYWINALYRAGYYQKRQEEPPPPMLKPFAPESRPPLSDADYPWPLCGHPHSTPESSSLWQRLSAEGVKLLKSRKQLGVTGASGCGRSNLIDSGVLPQFARDVSGDLKKFIFSLADDENDEITRTGRSREEDISFLSVLVRIGNSVRGQTPSIDSADLVRDPSAFARLLDAGGQPCLVVVHDLHELFALSDDSFDLEPSVGQRTFMAALTHLAKSEVGHYLIVDVQLEYLARLRAFPEFQALLDRPGEQATDGWLIVRLENEELRAFIVKPAEKIGLNFEAGLVDRIIFDHQSEPAAVTILLFTLRRLWMDMLDCQTQEGARRNMITWETYQRVGSGRLILEVAADEATRDILDAEPTDEAKDRALEAIHRTFIELVEIMPGSAWWLPRVPREKIDQVLVEDGHSPDRIRRVLEEFIRVGIFVETESPKGGTTLRIFHDALVSRWTRLVQWLEVERNQKRLRWMLRADAREWNRLFADPSTATEAGSGTGKHRPSLDGLKRLERRLSLLWRGAKLREARQFDHLSNREASFLKESKRFWYATIALLTLGIATIPILISIAVGVYLYHQNANLTTQYVNQGVNLVASGDDGFEGGLWLAAAYERSQNSLGGRIYQSVLHLVNPAAAKVSEEAHRLCIGMAFRRMPQLCGVLTVPDGMVAVDLSPSGKYAVLGCRKQGRIPGRVWLWNLAGKQETIVPESDEASIERVAFARDGDGTQDSFVAVGGSVKAGEKGVVYLWSFENDGVRFVEKIETDARVRDLIFLPPASDGTRYLALATGDETRPSTPGKTIIRVVPKAGAPAPADGVSAGAAELKVEIASAKEGLLTLPATHLAVSQGGRLAVSYLDQSAGLGRIAVFEKNQDNVWRGTEVSSSASVLPVAELSFSRSKDAPKREILAVATGRADQGDGAVRIFCPEGAAWKEPIQPRGPLKLGGGILHVAFDPQGRTLMAASASGLLGFWNVNDQGAATEKRSPINEGGWPFSAVWSPDGRWVATGNRDRHARVWDVASGRPVLPPLYHGATVSSLAFAPDGLSLLAATVYSAHLWRTTPREFPLLPVRAAERAYATTLSADGHHVIVASKRSGQARDGVPDTELTFWTDDQLAPAGRARPLPTVTSLATSDDGRYVAALLEKPAEGKPQALFWNTTTGEQRRVTVQDGANFLAIVPGESPRLLVAGSNPVAAPGGPSSRDVAFLQLFDMRAKEAPDVSLALDFRVKSFAATPDGRRLVIGGDGGLSPVDGWVATLAASDSSLRVLDRLKCHAEAVITLSLTTQGDRLFTGSIDDTVKLLGIDAAGKLAELKTQSATEDRGDHGADSGSGLDKQSHTADVILVAFSHDGRRAVSVGRDYTAILYDTEGGHLKPLEVLDDRGVISCVAFSPDSAWLATGGENGVCVRYVGADHTLWQAKRVAVLPHRYPVVDVAFEEVGQGSKKSMNVRTLAMEQTSAGAPTAQVESCRWNMDQELSSPEVFKNAAELLAGRKLVGDASTRVNLSSDDLRQHWVAAKADHPQTYEATREDLRRQAYFAATSGDWGLAAQYLRKWREKDAPDFEASLDTLRFAAESFESSGDPQEVLAITDRLLERIQPMGKDEPLKREESVYRAMHGIAQVELARLARAAGKSAEVQKFLEGAESDFKSRAPEAPDKWWWLIREAEANVLRERWDLAVACLEQSIAAHANIPQEQGGFGRDASSGSQEQRLAAIYLLQAADARAKTPQPDAAALALADECDRKWRDLTKGALQKHRNSSPAAKARVAWPAVLSDRATPEDAATAVAFAEAGVRDVPDNFGRINTLALALVRAGKLDDAQKQLNAATDSFERIRQADPAQQAVKRKTSKKGRPVDWTVQSLIFLARSRTADTPEQRAAFLAQARDFLNEARDPANDGSNDPLTKWRATWNSLDLRVLTAEVEQKLKEATPPPAPQ